VISVITAAYRPDTLLRAVASLEAQTFADWQHVVVHDGPAPDLRELMRGLGYGSHGKRVFAELGRNWHGFLGGDNAPQPPDTGGARGPRGSRGVSAYVAALYLASGDLIGYLDQDCEYGEHHLKLLHDALAAKPDAGFAYSKMQRVLDGMPWDVVGNGSPQHGRIDGNLVVHRAELLAVANWRWGGDADWDLIGRWVTGGASWEFVPEVTVHWHHASADI
jgi:glycosyltransferase involved in cell wall biosynthesis